MAKKSDLIYDFVRGRKKGKVSSLSIERGRKGTALYSYMTPIAFRNKKGDIFMADKKYSVTTSKDQNELKRAYDTKVENKEEFAERLKKDEIYYMGRLN